MEKKVWVIFSFFLALTLASFTSNCPQECKCVWASGNKQADCSQSNLNDIPKGLSGEIQNLDLTGNKLYEIKRHVFQDVGVINLKKVTLRECKLNTIQPNGFGGLAIMISLDLSENDLNILHPDTFNETAKIRWILLNNNKLEKLEDGLFNNLLFLQKVDLSNNRIAQVGTTTFKNVPRLNILKLNGNNLQSLNVDILNSLTSLLILDVSENPWKCDCTLQPFKNCKILCSL